MNKMRLNINSGSIVSIVGQKGSGKSTFCALLSESGEVSQFELLVNDKRDSTERKVCNISDFSRLAPNLSVAENIYLEHYKRKLIFGIDWNRIYAETSDLLLSLQITNITPESSTESATMLQKSCIQILKGLVSGCSFFIADEITKDLSVAEKNEFFVLLRKLKDKGKIIFFIPYLVEEISEISDHVIVLFKGTIVGQPLDIKESSYERILNMMMGHDGNNGIINQAFLEKYNITEREKEIILYISGGLSNQEISDKLDISLGTVKNHVFNIFQKTHAKSRIELCNLLKF